jgi:hypothetical protein
MQILSTRRTQSHRRGGNNGGFPDPPEGEPFRFVSCSHPSCGTETRIRLPRRLPERVVQRVVCDGCRQTFASPRLEPLEPGRDTEQAATAAATAVAFARVAERADPAVAAPEPALEPTAVPDGMLERIGGWTAGWGERLQGLGTANATGGSGGISDRIRDRLDALPWPSLPQIPPRQLWAWASVPLALLGVIVGLSLIQGSPPEPQAAAGTALSESADQGAKLVKDAGYSLALPAGWRQINPPDGATFAAESRDGSADATLWIERAPNLSLKDFERRSLEQLGEIAKNPRVVDRVNAPTIEGSIVELRGDAPVADGIATPYRVTLRGAGPFRHYLATAQQPGADPKIVADIEILHNSLRPEVKLAGTGGD